MKRIGYLLAIFLGISSLTNAQETEELPDGWRKGGAFNANFNQTTLANWAAGGDNSLSFSGSLSLFANLKQGKGSWNNSLLTQYGLTRTGNQDFRKSVDLLELNSKYGYAIARKWDYTTAFNFKTQYDKGFEFPEEGDKSLISDFFSPAYINLGTGFDWKPNNDFSLLLMPLNAKWTFVLSDDIDPTTFGVDSGKNVRTEFGFNLVASYIKALNESVNVNTSLTLFSGYLDHPERIDVNWKGLITAKVWKYLSVSLSMELIYDHDIDITTFEDGVPVLWPDGTERKGPKTQFSQVLAVGFTYSFGAKEATE